MKWYFDTSVFVAASVNTHPHYIQAISVLKELVTDHHEGYVSGHSLDRDLLGLGIQIVPHTLWHRFPVRIPLILLPVTRPAPAS